LQDRLGRLPDENGPVHRGQQIRLAIWHGDRTGPIRKGRCRSTGQASGRGRGSRHSRLDSGLWRDAWDEQLLTDAQHCIERDAIHPGDLLGIHLIAYRDTTQCVALLHDVYLLLGCGRRCNNGSRCSSLRHGQLCTGFSRGTLRPGDHQLLTDVQDGAHTDPIGIRDLLHGEPVQIGENADVLTRLHRVHPDRRRGRRQRCGRRRWRCGGCCGRGRARYKSGRCGDAAASRSSLPGARQ